MVIPPWYVVPPDECVKGVSPAYQTREDESWNLLTSPISLAIRRAE